MVSSGSIRIKRLSLTQFGIMIRKYNGKVLEADRCYTTPQKENTSEEICTIEIRL